MGVRTVLHYPDPRLRVPGQPVKEFGKALEPLLNDMAETMYASGGVGLAAPQIGVSLKLFIIDTEAGQEGPSDLRVFANPEILQLYGEVAFDEGCLSFPGVREEILRAERVKVRAQDQDGKWFELETDGLLGIAIQHEHDHVLGKLMVDRMSPLRRKLVHREMLKQVAA